MGLSVAYGKPLALGVGARHAVARLVAELLADTAIPDLMGAGG